jgi:RNA polymerase sigma-70 factor (ECF subfamily)
MKKEPEYIHNEWLVLRCKTHDDAAMAELIRRWQPRLRRVIWRLTDGHPDGDDIAQDVWMTVVRKLGRLDDPAAFPHWLYTIAAAKCADWARKQSRDRRVADASSEDIASAGRGQSDAETNGEHQSIIRRGLKALSEQQRLILTLFYLEEFSAKEIATILEIPVGTVKSRLYNARNELRKQIERSKQ